MPDYVIKSGTTYRIVSDHLGSVRLVVNAATGAVVQRMEYDAWGVVTEDSNPGFQSFGYAGGLWDAMTGFVRCGARDYDPAMGRWTSRDALGPVVSENLYIYVDNDPINHYDPSGYSKGGKQNRGVSGPIGDMIAKLNQLNRKIDGRLPSDKAKALIERLKEQIQAEIDAVPPGKHKSKLEGAFKIAKRYGKFGGVLCAIALDYRDTAANQSVPPLPVPGVPGEPRPEP